MFDFPLGIFLLPDQTAKLGMTLWSTVTTTIRLCFSHKNIRLPTDMKTEYIISFSYKNIRLPIDMKRVYHHHPSNTVYSTLKHG